MNINDVLDLIKAGFTADEVRGMMAGAAPAPADPPASVDPPAPADPPAPSPAPVSVPAHTELEQTINTKLDYLVNKLNYLSVRDSRQPDGGQQQTADDILKGMFAAPEQKK